jgi:peptidoglycan-N-acetylglucosamine deacetylase
VADRVMNAAGWDVELTDNCWVARALCEVYFGVERKIGIVITAQASRRTRTRSRGLAALASVVLLSACGAGAPAGLAPEPFGPSRGAPPLPVASPTRTPAAGAPVPAPGGEPSPVTGSSAHGPGGAGAVTTKAWVGTFRGHRITVPRGNGAHISFTFDDGPSPRFTPQVMALLDQHHVPAVFCLIGQQARAFPEVVRKEIKAGYVLCDHSRDHDELMNRRGQAYVTAEVTDGLAAIHAASPGTPVPFYRQPGGTWSPLVARAMEESRLSPLRWTDDPRDWSRPGSETVVRRVVAQLKPGGVILMHDGGGDRTQSVEALRWLLDALPAAGWVPVIAPQQKLTGRNAARPQ